MNETLRKVTVASALPDDLRGKIEPGNAVRVTVEDLGRPLLPVDRVLALQGAGSYMKTSIDQAVARIRSLRDDD
ncbi:hypothetical protein [Prosthecomicrobium sp. N25]|uniref:hypothetical protein n=1 Tax=Prosthecomicrobium sp. N25 TaxID=3129254 RepID=UPI003077F49C